MYCGSEFLKIARHLEHVHCSEPEVMKILSMERKETSTKQRRKMEFDKLRLKGNFYHNLRVLKCGGELKVLCRPAEGDLISYKQFIPCTHCLAFVQKTELWRHVAHCQFNQKCNEETKTENCSMKASFFYMEAKTTTATIK